MHIDHQKLVELLTETSGIEKEKVESQLEELIEEIKEALTEGDAYEVSGLGVFSGIGNNILFIPSDDFATEINYKYVGMEPIEMDDAAPETAGQAPTSEEDEPEEVVADAGEYDDPFGGLLEDENDPEEETPSFELDDSEDEPIVEDASEDVEDFADDEEEAPFDFADEDLDDDTVEEISDAEEPKPGPDKWGIDTYKDDSAERTFSGLLGDKEEEETADSGETNDSDLAAELNKQLSEGDEDDDSLDALFGDADVEEELGDEDESDGDDDPFAALAGDEEEEAAETPDELIDSDVIDEDQDEIIPVITNLASEETKKKRAEQEKEYSVQEDEEKAEKEEKSSKQPKRPSTSRDSQGAPVLLWVLLIIVLLAGGTYGLGYFGLVNIPGITPKATQQASTTQPDPVPLPPANETPAQQDNQANQPQSDSEQTSSSGEETSQQEAQNPPPEQAADNEVSQSDAVPAGQPMYGLKGVVNPNANDGYTIVVYSLSNEENAESTERQLRNEGYRVLLATIPSQQYGQLWRVSLGQFESMRDAAIAAETFDSPLSENYFITKIN